MKKKILTKEDILHLAKLARLTLTEDEIQKYLDQLEDTVEYIENLNELDTDIVRPTNSIVDLKNVYFKDGSENEKALTQEEATKNAKKIKNNMFIVDRIMQ